MKPVDRVEALVLSSSLVAYGRFSANGVVRYANARLATLIRGSNLHANLADLLVESQRVEVGRWLRDRDLAEWPEFLHFENGGGPPVTLRARTMWDGDELLLFAEPVIEELEATAFRRNHRSAEQRSPHSSHLGRRQSLSDSGRAKVAATARENHAALQTEVCDRLRACGAGTKMSRESDLAEMDLCTQLVELWLEAIESNLDSGCAVVAVEETYSLQLSYGGVDGDLSPGDCVRECFAELSRRIEARLDTDALRGEYGAYRKYVEGLIESVMTI